MGYSLVLRFDKPDISQQNDEYLGIQLALEEIDEICWEHRFKPFSYYVNTSDSYMCDEEDEYFYKKLTAEEREEFLDSMESGNFDHPEFLRKIAPRAKCDDILKSIPVIIDSIQNCLSYQMQIGEDSWKYLIEDLHRLKIMLEIGKSKGAKFCFTEL